MFKLRSVRAIAVAAILIFAVAASAVGVTILRLRTTIIDEGVKDTANIATVIAGQIDRSIQSIDLVLTELLDRISGLDIGSPAHLHQSATSGR